MNKVKCNVRAVYACTDPAILSHCTAPDVFSQTPSDKKASRLQCLRVQQVVEVVACTVCID